MTDVRAAILDIDGTLVDTNYQHSLAWYEAFRQHDIALPIWRIHRHLGMGGDKLVAAVAGDEIEHQQGDSIRAAHDTLYMASIDTVSALKDARELIQDLKRQGRAVVLASSAKAPEAERYVDLLDARELVDGWTTSEDVEQTKPSPDLISAALEKLDGGEAVMIGDTPWDIQAAAQLDVPTIALLTGGFSADQLMDAGASNVFESLGELREQLATTPLEPAFRGRAPRIDNGRAKGTNDEAPSTAQRGDAHAHRLLPIQ
jgi:HAD superfamily hydrolase (TIGR01549 family)